ncbi:MAG: aldolase/citrate lyase family protein [Desulfobacterales bacterium]|nr:aldolase/citrate lyase family protein [Desulfobacterales bacterium]
MKPLRTALFAPGNRGDRVEKAIRAGADAVIIDLEDAVSVSEKEKTRNSGCLKSINKIKKGGI